MKTWKEYKDHVKSVDPEAGADLVEAENMAAIVRALVEKRTELGYSQRELADICGMPQSSVARIEAMKTTPNLETLLRIMRPLGLKLTVSVME